MKKIAILTCIKSNSVCTGASCLKAMNERTRSFAPYKGEPLQLMAFLHCNGCACDYDTDPGFLEKLERLEQIGVEIVHAGICTRKHDGSECPQITKILSKMEETFLFFFLIRFRFIR